MITSLEFHHTKFFVDFVGGQGRRMNGLSNYGSGVSIHCHYLSENRRLNYGDPPPKPSRSREKLLPIFINAMDEFERFNFINRLLP